MIEKIKEGVAAPLTWLDDALTWLNHTIYVLGLLFVVILIKVNIYNEPVKIMYLSFDKEVKSKDKE